MSCANKSNSILIKHVIGDFFGHEHLVLTRSQKTGLYVSWSGRRQRLATYRPVYPLMNGGHGRALTVTGQGHGLCRDTLLHWQLCAAKEQIVSATWQSHIK